MQRTTEQNLSHADMADARTLNEIIWYSVRGRNVPMPEVVRLPAFDAMRLGLRVETDEQEIAGNKKRGRKRAERED